jgi:hypothetical protein
MADDWRNPDYHFHDNRVNMTFRQRLDLVIARTQVRRYEYLCLEHPDPTVRRQYREFIVRESEKDPESEPVVFDWTNWDNRECGGCGESVPDNPRGHKP